MNPFDHDYDLNRPRDLPRSADDAFDLSLSIVLFVLLVLVCSGAAAVEAGL